MTHKSTRKNYIQIRATENLKSLLKLYTDLKWDESDVNIYQTDIIVRALLKLIMSDKKIARSYQAKIDALVEKVIHEYATRSKK